MLQVESTVGKVMGSIVYILSDGINHDYFLVDIGDFEVVQSILPNDANVLGVFITHGHHDHIYSINKLKEAFPECKVFASKDGCKMLASAKANLSFYVEMPVAYDGDVSILNDGDSIELFDGIYLTAIATPGHNPSCLTFQIEDYLFTGDSYIPGVKVVTNLPGGNKDQAQESVKKILEMASGKTICPGHLTIQSDKLI